MRYKRTSKNQEKRTDRHPENKSKWKLRDQLFLFFMLRFLSCFGGPISNSHFYNQCLSQKSYYTADPNLMLLRTAILGCQWYSELLINNKHETELNDRMEWNWDHFHRFRHCPLSYMLLLKWDFCTIFKWDFCRFTTFFLRVMLKDSSLDIVKKYWLVLFARVEKILNSALIWPIFCCPSTFLTLHKVGASIWQVTTILCQMTGLPIFC